MSTVCKCHTVLTAHNADPQDHSQPQLAQPVQNTICSRIRSYSPDGGHNDARNMLRKRFSNDEIRCIVFVLSLHPTQYIHDARSQESKT